MSLMKYVIMCGGQYDKFDTPRPLIKIGGESLLDRTIRLLRSNGIDRTQIYISSNDSIYDTYLLDRLEHENNYRAHEDYLEGYWLDAFYPNFDKDTKVTYLFGDVFYTEFAISKIINCTKSGNILFGSAAAKNESHQNWGEPFAYRVNDYETFMSGIRDVKKLQDEGKIKRVALVWELYRYLNDLDINVQEVLDETYEIIDDETIDIDAPWQVDKMNHDGRYCWS